LLLVSNVRVGGLFCSDLIGASIKKFSPPFQDKFLLMNMPTTCSYLKHSQDILTRKNIQFYRISTEGDAFLLFYSDGPLSPMIYVLMHAASYTEKP
jgi:hypothetical protein